MVNSCVCFVVQASLKVGDSEWSDKFSLDTVGSGGTVTCKFQGHTLEVSIAFDVVG